MAVLLVCRLVIAVFAFHDGGAGSVDFDRFWAIATSTGQPYVAFPVEYTPSLVTGLHILHRYAVTRHAFGSALVATAVAADLTTTIALALTFGWNTALAYLVVTSPLVGLFYRRIDLVPAAAATLAAAGMRSNRPAAAAAALVGGIAVKLWPLPLAVCLLRGDWAARRRAVTVLALAAAAVAALWLAAAGWHGLLQIVTFRSATGWQIESIVGNAIAVSSTPRIIRSEAGAFRVAYVSSQMTLALLFAGTLSACVIAWIGAGSRRPGSTWIAAVGMLLLASPLLSPQFMAWLAPAIAIAWAEDDRRAAWWGAVALVMTAVYWPRYMDIVRGSRLEWLITARNLALCAMVWLAVDAVSRGPRQSAGAVPSEV